jgi:hypothetical protein
MNKLLSIVAILALSSMSAMAAGTAAGVEVANTATLSFSVSGVTQTPITSNEDKFLVDKKIDFILENKDAEQIVVVPGSTDQITTWEIKNEGNLAQNFTFTAVQLTGGESIYSDADTHDSDALVLEYNNAGTWTPLTSLVIAPDAIISVRVKTNIDITRVDGNVMNIALTAEAVDASGTAEVATAAADTKNAIDTVLAEGAGATGDLKEDGSFVAWGGYIVGAPNLSLTKTSCVLKDPINGVSANAKRIPGATVLYMLDIDNVGTSTDATNVEISDGLAATLDSGTITNLKQHDGQSACSCTNGTAYAGGTAATNSGSGSDITVSGLTITKAKHNCVSFEVDIL